MDSNGCKSSSVPTRHLLGRVLTRMFGTFDTVSLIKPIQVAHVDTKTRMLATPFKSTRCAINGRIVARSLTIFFAFAAVCWLSVPTVTAQTSPYNAQNFSENFSSQNPARTENQQARISAVPTATPSSGSSTLSTAKPATVSPGNETSVVTTDPNQLVLNAVHQAVWGPPVACKVYQRSAAFDQQVIASGEYKSAGNGTGQFRYSARISAGDTTFDMIQVSDGRLMYTQLGLNEPPRRVIIDQVRQAMGHAINQANERPEVNLYMSIGGHPELLRGLYHRYRWYSGTAGKLGGVDVWQLVGRLRTEPPKLMSNTILDHQNAQAAGLANELPTEVRLTLGRSTSMAYFPYMVEYFQRRKNANGQPTSLELTSIIEHLEPNLTVNFSDREFEFRVPENVEKIEDETNLYLPREPVAGITSFPVR